MPNEICCLSRPLDRRDKQKLSRYRARLPKINCGVLLENRFEPERWNLDVANMAIPERWRKIRVLCDSSQDCRPICEKS